VYVNHNNLSKSFPNANLWVFSYENSFALASAVWFSNVCFVFLLTTKSLKITVTTKGMVINVIVW